MAKAKQELPPFNGALLKSKRRLSGLSIEKVSKIARVSFTTIVRLETGRDIGAAAYIRYCRAIGLPADVAYLPEQDVPVAPKVKTAEEIMR